MSSDEPSIPMDQEEEDNDEFFSARETQKKNSQENLRSSTPTPTNKSDRDGASPTSKKSSSGRSDKQQQAFFSDEAAQQGSENSSTKKSERVRRMLKDRNRWDTREWKKEELERKKKKKKKKSKNKKKTEVDEPSKTDEGSEENDENQETKEGGVPASSPSEERTPQPRSFFQSDQLILKCKSEKPVAPKVGFNVLRFAKTQEVVEFDSEGIQHLLSHYNERAISNPWRRWGAHRALCDQGGFLVDKNKKIVEIKRGSDPPPCPPNPKQVTLNKNAEAPDSQTMMGTLRVEVGPAEDEVHRIGKAMEEYVRNGGFVPPPLTKKEMAKTPAAKTPKKQPLVVVQTKPKEPLSGNKPKPKKKTSKEKVKKKSGSESDSVTEDDSAAEKTKEAKVKPSHSKDKEDDSKKRNFPFFKRKKPGAPAGGKANKKSNIEKQRSVR